MKGRAVLRHSRRWIAAARRAMVAPTRRREPTDVDRATDLPPEPGRTRQPAGHHIAELNIGRLVAETDDPRVAEFMAALDTVNGLGKRMPGFVWMMEGSGAPGTGNTETKLEGDPRFVSNLTVWEDVDSLGRFVFETVHARFYARRADWFEVLGAQHFVMWWVPAGHRPTLDEAMQRLAMRERDGDSDRAFGWSWLEQGRAFSAKRCAPA
jgi:hypothetical protein